MTSGEEVIAITEVPGLLMGIILATILLAFALALGRKPEDRHK